MIKSEKLFANNDINITLIAIVIGIICGGLAILFRESVSGLLALIFSANENSLSEYIKKLPFWIIVIVPTVGGLAVGLIAKYFMPINRPQGMTEVIETAIRPNSKISMSSTISAFFINVITLGTGGSTGREGPIVHLASGVSNFILDKFNISSSNRKVLLGCAAASAVSSAFNAPIAGVFFAAELITGSYAMSHFVPVVVASICGGFLSSLVYGSHPAFFVSGVIDFSLYEIPLFILLGIICSYLVKAFIGGVNIVFQFAKNKNIPIWICPAIGGFMVGVIAIFLPEVMGDGYYTTNKALSGLLSLQILFVLLIAKMLATILTVGFGGGGGVFSPALFIGAMLGGVFGFIAYKIMIYFGFYSQVNSITYSVAGMGAFAGAIMGAPISTVFMIFELTNNYMLTLAVMISTFVASRGMQKINVPSFFVWQLKNRGIDIGGGSENILIRDFKIKNILITKFKTVHKNEKLSIVRTILQKERMGDIFVVDDDNSLLGDVCLYSMAESAFDNKNDNKYSAIDVADTNTKTININASLEEVLNIYRYGNDTIVAVVDDNNIIVGVLHENDVLRQYQKIINETRNQERI